MDNLEANTALLESANAFIRSNVLADFVPAAYYDTDLDCVRVIIRDCSVSEVRINEYLTIAEDNNYVSPSDRYVGFTVKGVRHFLESKKSDYREIVPLVEQMLSELPNLFKGSQGKTMVEMAVNISFLILKEAQEKNVQLPQLKLAA